jgi:hypothetical protein
MKLLMFGAPRFWYKSFEKALPTAPDVAVEETVMDATVVFIHVEPSDAERPGPARTKLLKNIKWMANKRDMRHVVLHSFTHLSDESADATFAHGLIEDAAERLRNVGYEVWVTPFGYLCEWEMRVFGESLSRVFKAF